VPFFIRPVVKGIADKVTSSFIAPNIERQLEFHGERTGQTRHWFAGKAFTAADIQMSFPLEAAAARAGLGPSRPRLMDWLSRDPRHGRAAYRRALKARRALLLRRLRLRPQVTSGAQPVGQRCRASAP